MDLDLLKLTVAIAALPISIFAAIMSIRADRRARIAALTQTYLTLRTRFIGVHEKLPSSYSSPTWRVRDKNEDAAVSRYWHHAFDEWYLTNRLDQPLLSKLWDDFFKDAVVSGLRHNGLRVAFNELVRTKREHDKLWRQFSDVLDQAYRQTHPENAGKCKGLHCEHPTEA